MIRIERNFIAIRLKKYLLKIDRIQQLVCFNWNQKKIEILSSDMCLTKSKLIHILMSFKKKLFHVYLSIINHFLNEITNDNVNIVVKIVISFMSNDYITNSKFKKTRLYNLMTSHIIYKNCFKLKNAICHDKNDVCIKRFFKSQRNIIDFNHSFDYSQMRRFARKCVSNTSWNNIWIISYNEYLLLKYEIHINIEICTSIKSMIYFYKYIFKNFNSIDISI